MNILFIEYNFFHDEVLIPQIDFVYEMALNNDKLNLFMIMNQDVKKRETLDLSNYPNFVDNIGCKLIKKRYNKSAQFLNYIYVLRTLSYIFFHKVDVIVFNTIDSYNEDIEFLLKMLPVKVKKIGILHNADLIETYENKYDQVLVLSELIAKNLDMGKVNYIYTLLYKYKNMKQVSTLTMNTNLNKNLKICIPGNIEKTRRDYQYIIDFVAENQQFCRSHQIQFILLGNINTVEGIRLKKQMVEQQLENFFQLFDHFVGYKKFMDTIYSSDIIMPLIHRSVENFVSYKSVKISDAFNMAFSCNKPMLMDMTFEEDEEFANFSFFYDYKDSISLKEVLLMIFGNKNLLQAKINSIKNEKKFSFKYQQEKYFALLTKAVE